MNTKITEKEIEAIAQYFGISVRLLKTIYLVESSGSGFDSKTGLLKIQFEPHIFHRELRARGFCTSIYKFLVRKRAYYKVVVTYPEGKQASITNTVDVQSEEWKALCEAIAIHREAALLSTSYGLGQIMGFNYKAAGFNSVEDMFAAFKKSEYEQLIGMMKFIFSNKRLARALTARDWKVVARIYNGPAYEEFDYHGKLERTYEKLGK
jgi:hypothetical protein